MEGMRKGVMRMDGAHMATLHAEEISCGRRPTILGGLREKQRKKKKKKSHDSKAKRTCIIGHLGKR